MKKVLTFCVTIIYFVVTAQAQCPTQIVDDSRNGMRYRLFLSSDQCANFPVPFAITIQGVDYLVSNCSNDFSIFTLTVVFNGSASFTPVVLATAAPITVASNIFSNCIYNSVGNPITLPVELIEFKSISSVSGNTLTWATAQEVSNRGFQVERLVSDKTWLPLSFIKSKGPYSKYVFTDNNPLAISYYRLRQINNDSTETFSKVVGVAQSGNDKGLKVYPTLVTNGILTINTEAGQLRGFSVTNLLGQQVLVGKTTHQIDVSALSQGTYVLKVGTEIAKFTKQ